MDLHRSFTEHPASVGETYWGHLLHASWFAGKMLLGAGACLVHAIFPFLFVKTGSQAITQLYSEMVTQRSAVAAAKVDLAGQGHFRGAK
jgi:uncharacterized protein DUF6356